MPAIDHGVRETYAGTSDELRLCHFENFVYFFAVAVDA